MRRVVWVLMLAASLASGPARAAMSEADAAALRAQIQTWLTTWSFGLLDANVVPLTVTAADDHLNLQIPFGGTLPDKSARLSNGAVTVRLQPLDGGRWTIVSADLPPTVTLALTGPGAKKRPSTTMTFGRQTVSGVFDPSLATESRLDAVLENYAVTVAQPRGSQATRIAKMTSHNLWTPIGNGHVTMTGEADLEGYAISDSTDASKSMRATVRHIHVRGLLDDFDFARFGDGLRVLSMAKDVSAAPKGKKKDLTPAQRATLHAAIDAFAGVLGGVDSEQVWEGVQFTVGAQSGSVQKVSLGFAARAADGKVQVKMPIAMEAFDSPAITDKALREMLPHSIALTPRLSGLSRQALLDAMHRQVDLNGDAPDMEAEAGAILEAGKVLLALDDFSVDIGPMHVKGGGQVDIAAADEFQGQAEFRATGLDALIRRANTIAEVKQAVPVLIFLKGIAVQDGPQSVWKITYADGAIEVNGTSLSDLSFPGK